MLLFVVILSLTLQPGLSQRCVNNGIPAQYDTFRIQHLNDKIPENADKSEWQKFIGHIGTWDRPIQSFFLKSEHSNAFAVCSTAGKIYPSRNLCISKKPISFYNVKVSQNKKVTDVKLITDRHVILGCEKIENKCLPIHFEANENKAKPADNAPNCS
ncbi:hypothetical protein R3I93_019260 [Phoxinus phoxinus]|uniref:Uncharacterized protein n=1 Tax=Phoxinus phoxinus TaxID=58324 RepID=A0AAN9CAX7_9TELE